MANLIVNNFTEYELTEEELLQSHILNELQTKLLQTRLAQSSLQRLSIKVDTNNIQAFIQEEAELKGEVNILTWLLEASKAAAEEVVKLHNQVESTEVGSVNFDQF